ncbi:MAG: hypothetical protein IIX11_07455 [Selenomonadales bacterium]|nr:hypothetical protein [Selenomonadales bacterium]
MKEGLMWFIVAVVLGTIIPSKGWLAVFVLVVSFLGCLMQHISDKKTEAEKRQRRELPLPSPAKPIDRSRLAANIYNSPKMRINYTQTKKYTTAARRSDDTGSHK